MCEKATPNVSGAVASANPAPTGPTREYVLDLGREAAYEIEALGGLLVRESKNDSDSLQLIVRAIGVRLMSLYNPLHLALAIEDITPNTIRDAAIALHALQFPQLPRSES